MKTFISSLHRVSSTLTVLLAWVLKCSNGSTELDIFSSVRGAVDSQIKPILGNTDILEALFSGGKET